MAASMKRTDPLSSAPGPGTDQLLASAISQHRAGRLAEAEQLYRQVLTADPANADALHLLGIVAHQRGQHETAVDLIGRAIAYGAPLPQFHYNLGLALAALGRSDDAATQFTRAIALKDDYADAHASLGDAQRAQGLTEQALRTYQRAEQLKAPSAELHNNIGATLLALGRVDEGIARCERAVAIKPDLFEAHVNLARLHYVAGRAAQATAFAARALDLRETLEAKAVFVRCVRDTKATGDVGSLRGLILRGLTEPWGRPDELAAFTTSIVLRDDALRAAVSRAAAEWPRHLPAREYSNPALLPALHDRLLQCLLAVTPVVDIALEQFLTGVRRVMLETAMHADVTGPDDGLLRFYCALARQCFVNEYVFFCGADEASDAQRLRDSLAQALASGAPVSPLRAVAIAAYFPLYTLPEAQELETRAWPDCINELLTQQIREPREERLLRASIPRLTAIEDDVSLKVRDMYEENPYPRWIKVAPTESPKPLDVYLRDRFPVAARRVLPAKASLDILIAGCGTGRQAVEMAQRFEGAKILAIDLSLASLSYAKRKTREMGLGNIEYGQADILKLGGLGRSFDVIESSGVLHHLDDPWTGWRALLSLLKPGGHMRVGLYSELGRPGVIAGRALIAERGYRADVEGIQRFRQELVTGNHGPPLADLMTRARDFFTTSELRDLVFHVREHRMSIPQIEAFLRENDLEFLGFEADAQLARRYRARFPEDAAMTRLDHWHVFETEDPAAFFYTYQFWVWRRAG
jgi:tetratricopeptide (TPR) repeat protein/2-polyprenyl-3-methyl-5-hydroxy-6-metoxy-1,4-benzoquinol methylase